MYSEVPADVNADLSLFVSVAVCPKTLMSQTRLVIRRSIPSLNKEAAVESLDIPLILRNYLKHETSELI